MEDGKIDSMDTESGEANELGEEFESLISDAPIGIDEKPKDEGITNLPNLYRGEALNNKELYELTARRQVDLVYVAGSVHCGKTTLLTMMHHMFMSGVNKNLEFAGSLTLIGFKKRTAGLLIANGNFKPQMKRTSSLDPDVFLHLVLADQEKEKYELVFTDLSGELVGSVSADDLQQKYVFDGFRHSGNVIIVIDGELLCGKRRFAAQNEGYGTFTSLYEQHIIGEKTVVHMVISKYDIIESEPSGKTIGYQIKKYENEFTNKMKDKCASIQFYNTAAISQIDKIDNYYGLENLLKGLLANSFVHKKNMEKMKSEYFTVYADRNLTQRSFEKFAWKG